MVANALDRALSRYIPEPNSGCWLWSAALDDRGYGRISVQGKWRHAHRFLYEQLVCDVPDGLELDHKCRMPCCVNPDHLEPVTHQENIRRAGAAGAMGQANKKKSMCPKGHEYDYVTSTGRRCKTCRREYMREYFARRRMEGA